MKKEFNVIIEKDSKGWYIGTVPELKGCHSQAKSLDKLMERMEEAIALCLEVEEKDYKTKYDFVGVQRLAVNL